MQHCVGCIRHTTLSRRKFLFGHLGNYLSVAIGHKKKKQSVRGTIFAYWLTDENNFYLPSSERRFSKYHCRNISGPASLSAPLESATAQATRERKKSTSRKKNACFNSLLICVFINDGLVVLLNLSRSDSAVLCFISFVAGARVEFFIKTICDVKIKTFAKEE